MGRNGIGILGTGLWAGGYCNGNYECAIWQYSREHVPGANQWLFLDNFESLHISLLVDCLLQLLRNSWRLELLCRKSHKMT